MKVTNTSALKKERESNAFWKYSFNEGAKITIFM
jgi:hypothetical protein